MKCPYCAETIQDEAKKCRFCGEFLTRDNKIGFPQSSATSPPSTSDSISEEAQRVYEQGVRMLQDGQKREALDAFHKAAEIDPNCVDACVALAKSYHAVDAQKYYDELAYFAEQAFRAAPNNPKARNIQSAAHFVKGQMAWDIKDWHEATLCFKQSYQIEPNQQTLAAFGHCAEEADELGILADACEARLKEQPDDYEVRYMLGRTFVNMAVKDPSEPDKTWRNTEYLREYLRRAEEQLTTFLSIDPVSVDGNYWLGIIFSMTDRLDEATNIVVKLKNIDSEMSKDLADLIEEQLTTILSIDPVSADGNYWLGIIFSMTDRLDEAANIVVKLKNIDSEKSKDLADLINV